jgi:single-strand DNA-binding protein
MNKVKNSEQPKAAPAYQNRVTLVGFLADKADYYETGFAVLRLATKVSWKDKTSGKWQSHTDWHRIVVWQELAEAVKHLGKGDHVMVEGHLRTGQYERNVQVEGATVGTVTMKTCEIRARSVRKLVRKKKAAKPATTAA